jgi:hypothetical protein
VLIKYLVQVLQAVIGCEAGVYLSDESICKAYQAAFMLGNLDADVRASKSSQVRNGLWEHMSLPRPGITNPVILGDKRP